MLTKYAAHLLATGQQLHAVELYRKAKQHAEAAKLLNKLAKAAGSSRINPLRAKKLYVIAAMEAERMRRKMLSGAPRTPTPTQTQTQTRTSTPTPTPTPTPNPALTVLPNRNPNPLSLAGARDRNVPHASPQHRLPLRGLPCGPNPDPIPKPNP